MKLQPNIADFILSADSKALATNGPAGLNVAPVSTVKIHDGKILLVNYFMNKTLTNLLENPDVSLACWSGLVGYQIKATADYLTEGEVFDSTKAWIAEILPDRTVKGVILLEPTVIFDLTAGAENSGAQLA